MILLFLRRFIIDQVKIGKFIAEKRMVLCFISLIVLIVALKFQNVKIYIIGTIAGMLSILFYIVLYNQMMIYVENNAYKKIEK